jgi:hypothetical protein
MSIQRTLAPPARNAKVAHELAEGLNANFDGGFLLAAHAHSLAQSKHVTQCYGRCNTLFRLFSKPWRHVTVQAEPEWNAQERLAVCWALFPPR